MTASNALGITLDELLDQRHSLPGVTASGIQPNGHWAGSFTGRRRGQGSEFDDLRQYVAGDDVRNIDWKASARTNSLNTRLYREEREHRSCLIVDLRDCMFTGSRQLRAATACRLAARIAWLAAEGGSRVSAVTISQAGLCSTEQRSGHSAAIAACRLMAGNFHSIMSRLDRRSQQTGTKDTLMMTVAAEDLPTPAVKNDAIAEICLEQVAHWLLLQRQERARLFWCTGLDHCGTGFDAAMQLLSETREQICLYTDDPLLETPLPAGQYSYCKPGTDGNASSVSIGRRDKARLGRALSQHRKALDLRFREMSIPLFSSRMPAAELVARLRAEAWLP